ncbi:MAG: DUF4276 family protein [Bacteroidota bacterium]
MKERFQYENFIPYVQLHEFETLLLSKPSRRIIRYLPEYQKQKTTAGVITAEKIGLSLLRNRCPHFNDWINTLESL